MNGKNMILPGILVLAAVLAAGVVRSQPMPWQAAAETKAVAAAEQWLRVVDQGKYAESWDEASPYFQKAMTRDKWVQSMDAYREPLGKVLERKVKSARFTPVLPGAPDGKYVVIQFDTSFANKKSALETVTPMMDPEGTWHVSGYYIK